MFEMLGIDVGDDGDRPVEAEEAAVALVGLDHPPVAFAEPGVGAVAVDDPAVDHGRVEPAAVEQRGDHGGGRRLAVRAGDRDRLLHAHQLGEHLGALTRGSRRSAAASISGLSSLIADEQTTTAASPRLSVEWPMLTGIPALRSFSTT